jgi:hypothetical protein
LKNKIQLLIKNFIESTTNIATLNSRTLFVREHIRDIINLTDFLPDNSKTNERLYIIHNNLSDEDLKCQMCNNKRKFYTFTKGYNLCCSQSCATKYQQAYLIEDKDEIYRERSLKNSLKSEEVKRIEVEKRINTTKEHYGDDVFSEIGRKSYETKVEKGTFIPLSHIIMNNYPELHKEMHIKSANTMKNNIDENGNNHYERRTLQNYENGIWTRQEDKSDLDHYRTKVFKVMYKFKEEIKQLENFDKRGYVNQGKYHLDHKFSIIAGFKQNIPPHIIGNINNLEMILGRNNLIKNRKCSIDLDELIDSILK